MVLITGGAYQDKLTFAKEKIKKEHPIIVECADAFSKEMYQADIISHLHLYVKEWLKEYKDPYPLIQEILENNPQVIITMNQLGCGIVPIDDFDRSYRETVGRIGCKLAKQAEEVWLVNAGIGMKLK